MDIVMLGNSSAGKTTYVALMYAVMQEGIGGFAVRAEKPAHHRSLIRTAEAVLEGRYPDPSDRRSVFDLVLRHDDEDVFPFAWRDYRGGTLREKTTGSPQARQLHEDLKAAGGIVVFCDSQKLLEDPRASRDVRTLFSHVQRALDDRGDRVTPLVLALTKADLVDLEDDKVTDKLSEPFLPLIEAVQPKENVIGTVVPISCGPDPVNVAVPVLWTLRFAILGQALELQASVESQVAAARQAAGRDTLWDRFSSWANDEPSWNSISRTHWQQAAAEYARFEPLVQPAERLGELLEGMPGF